MNIHAPQSYDTEAELKYLSMASQNITTPQEGKSVASLKQDGLIAAFLMTRRKFPLTRGQFSNICMKASTPSGDIIYNIARLKLIKSVLKKYNKYTTEKESLWNGRGLISLLLPYDFNYTKKNNAHPDEPTVIIRQGIFLEGALDKSTLGSAHGSIIQILNKEYGDAITSNFIDNMQFIGNEWLLVHGFSIGLEDCMITSEKSVLAIKDTLAQCYTKAQGIQETTQNPGIREVRVTAALSQAKDVGMKIAKEAMHPLNNFLVTVTSGSKGDFFNIAQLTGLLGQQNLEGHRVEPVLNHGTRSLPHYPFGKLEGKDEYISRGFIEHSFIHGLTPQEFFFHAMSGREGVADTAKGTAHSGYIQRKIVKNCEDIQVQYDGTVRDCSGKIYQFSYGDNGYDPTKVVKVDGESVPCDVSRLVDRLNTIYETTGVPDEKKNIYDSDCEPEIEVEFIPPPSELKRQAQRRKIINFIKKKHPSAVIDDTLDLEELTERLAALDLEAKLALDADAAKDKDIDDDKEADDEPELDEVIQIEDNEESEGGSERDGDDTDEEEDELLDIEGFGDEEDEPVDEPVSDGGGDDGDRGDDGE